MIALFTEGLMIGIMALSTVNILVRGDIFLSIGFIAIDALLFSAVISQLKFYISEYKKTDASVILKEISDIFISRLIVIIILIPLFLAEILL